MSHQTSGNQFLIEALDQEGEVMAALLVDDPSPDSELVAGALRDLDGHDCWTLRVTWASRKRKQVEEFHGQAALSSRLLRLW
jgi:hypothetical protein